MPDIHAEAVLAFVRKASIEPTWDLAYLSRELGLSAAEARQVVAVLAAMGYVERADSPKERWRTTEQGDVAAGAKPPRVRRATAEKALATVVDRIAAANASGEELPIARAITFGQYLSDHDLIQAVDIGIEFTGTTAPQGETAVTHRTREARLRELKARSSALAIHEFAPWMERLRHEQIWPAGDRKLKQTSPTKRTGSRPRKAPSKDSAKS